VTLTAGLCLPEDEPAERRAFLLEGAKAALEELAPAGAWLGERLQAVQFLCAHSAAMHWQARANARDLSEQVRVTAQRFAAQMMTLTSRQLAALARLRDQHRREAEAAERQAWRREAQATREQFARGSAFTAELERMMKLSDEAAVPEAAAEPTATPIPRAAPGSAGGFAEEPPEAASRSMLDGSASSGSGITSYRDFNTMSS
jgi:hypothetical protein